MSFHQKRKNIETISVKCVIVNQSQSVRFQGRAHDLFAFFSRIFNP